MEAALDSQNKLFQELRVREMKVVNPTSFLICAEKSSSMTPTQKRHRTIIGYSHSLPMCSRRKVDRKGKLCKST